MKKFEYKIIIGDANKDQNEFESEMNKLGQEGWELISAFDYSASGLTQWALQASVTSGYIFIYKREISS